MRDVKDKYTRARAFFRSSCVCKRPPIDQRGRSEFSPVTDVSVLYVRVVARGRVRRNVLTGVGVRWWVC